MRILPGQDEGEVYMTLLVADQAPAATTDIAAGS
jgi:hypothetical protein